jgi:type IV fimbrial biogenesis protein FimT
MNAPCALASSPHRVVRGGRSVRGFTLVELMTVVSILAVMLGILAPSFSDILASQQAKGMTYDLTSDLMLARNEALKRNVSISITPSGGSWAQGWTVATVATAEQLSQHNPGTLTVTVNNAPAAIRFDPNGRVSSPLGSVRITIGGGSNYRCVELDPSGRVRSTYGACS